jgi:hypothetical protein
MSIGEVRRGVVEAVLSLAEEEWLGIDACFVSGDVLSQHGFLGLFEDAIHSAQDGEGQNDFAVFGLLVVAAQQIGDGPYKGGKTHVLGVLGNAMGLS